MTLSKKKKKACNILVESMKLKGLLWVKMQKKISLPDCLHVTYYPE